jgi:putative ABC transport system substrate-binding protein
MFYLSGVCMGCLLNGERPVDLPVQHATEVELIINLTTAKTRECLPPLADSCLAHGIGGGIVPLGGVT